MSQGIDRSTAQWYVDAALAKLLARADELVEAGGDELLCRRPDVEGANSVYALGVHCCGVMERWGGETIAGREIHRDRPAEFTATGTIGRLEALVADQRSRVEQVVRSGFWPMTLGMTGQFVLLFCLYWVAARTVGVDLPIAELITAYTFRQLLTVFAVTPGGLGVTEVGTAGVLVLLGAGAGAASATALLYAIYAHLVVVPFGVAALVSWWFGSGPGRATART